MITPPPPSSSLDAPLTDDRDALVCTIDVEGASMVTWVYPGRGEKTILAVHGFRGDHHGLRRLVNATPEYTWIIPDLPGYGASTAFADGGHTATGFHRAIDAVREACAFYGEAASASVPASDLVLLGHSFGSVVAATYAAENPEAFAHVVLINPIAEPPLGGSQWLLTQATRGLYRLGALLPGRWGRWILSSPLLVDGATVAMRTDPDPVTRAYVRDQHRAYMSGFASTEVLLETYESSVHCTVLDVAEQVSTPTLLIAGAGDPLGSAESQRALEAVFPDAQLELIPRVGHLIHYEAPRTAAVAMQGWFQTRPARARADHRPGPSPWDPGVATPTPCGGA